jgi:predicted transposase YdaD
MVKQFDAVTRSLLEKHPADWLAAFGLGRGWPVDVVNSDLSTVTAEADKVIRVEGVVPWLFHVELQTRYDGRLPLRLLRYNVLLSHRHGCPVHTLAVLLRPAADGPALDGVFRQGSPDGRCRLEFHYQVVRAWELDLEQLLAGGIGTLPLAPLAVRSEEQMPAVVEALMRRVDPVAATAEAKELWAASAVLAGLRFPWESIKHWFRGVAVMRESSVYEGLLQEGRAEGRVEGRAEEARKILLKQGGIRFGHPADPASKAVLEALADLERLERLTERVLIVSSWGELLAES